MRAPTDQDIAIVGVGLQSALGDLDATTHSALAQVSAVRPVAPDGFAARIEAPTLDVPLPRELEPQVKFLSGSGVLSAAATHAAWTDADAEQVPDVRRGLYLAQMDADDWNCRDFRNAVATATTDAGDLAQTDLNRASVRQVKPFFLLDSLKNNAFSFLATWLGLRGTNTSAAGTTSLGTTLLGMAMQALRDQRIDRALYAGAARLTAGTALHELALAKRRAPSAGGTPAPLTSTAVGLVPGDIAGTLVLSMRTEAPAEAITILGLASTTCLTAEAQAHPDGLCDAARIALAEAGAELSDMRAIVAPGGGSDAEVVALERLHAQAPGVPVTCFSGWTGYGGLGSDAADLALAVHALRSGTLAGAQIPAEATPRVPALSANPISLSPGASVLVLSSGTFGHAGAVVLHRPH